MENVNTRVGMEMLEVNQKQACQDLIRAGVRENTSYALVAAGE